MCITQRPSLCAGITPFHLHYRWHNRCVLVVGRTKIWRRPSNSGGSSPSLRQSVTLSSRQSAIQGTLTRHEDIIYKQMHLSFLWRISRVRSPESRARNPEPAIRDESQKCRQTNPKPVRVSERYRYGRVAFSQTGSRITLV